MMNVATQAATRLARPGGGVGDVSATQSVPFQNDIRSRLHSVARPAHGAPWLCGPASRRVCHFVEAGRKDAVSQASGGTHQKGYGRPSSRAMDKWVHAPRPSDYEEPIPTDLHLRRPLAAAQGPHHVGAHARPSTNRDEAAG
jgi:hypothetical protein